MRSARPTTTTTHSAEIARLLDDRRLRSITGHGELDDPHGQLLRDPLDAGGSIEITG